MRPTGALHLGHLCGALANWRELQNSRECFFFVADWHALTTEYAAPPDLAEQSRKMVADWLAAGIDPERATLFVQSQVPAHAELFAVLSSLCPLSWLEGVPTYREQLEQLGEHRELATFGFLGYPLLQAADILIYHAHEVPVGEDQAPHVEFAREIVRRFNRIYGDASPPTADTVKERELLEKIQANRRIFEERGDREALSAAARKAIDACEGLSYKKRREWIGYALEGVRQILTPPEARLTSDPRLPGVDGRKMSKSYGNTVDLQDAPDIVQTKLVRMVTDPARKRRDDKGDPDKCPAFAIHRAFSDSETVAWAADGCRSASIGCVDCKKALAENVNAELKPIQCKLDGLRDDDISDILRDGGKKAREVAEKTMADVREAMKMSWPQLGRQFSLEEKLS